MIKKLLLLLLIYTSGLFSANAQNKISFTEQKIQSTVLDEKFKSYKVLKIKDDLYQVSDGQQMTIHLDQDYNFELKENRLLANNCTVSIKDRNGSSRKTVDETGFNGAYFQNKGSSNDHRLAFSMFGGRYSFYIKSGSNEFYIEPLANTDKSAAPDQYVYYEVKDIIANRDFNCGFKADGHSPETRAQDRQNTTTGGCKTVGLDFMVDYSMYETYGTIDGAINRTLELLNLSQVNYTIANGLDNEVSFKVYEYCVVTCETCNAWPSTLEIGDNYDHFYYAYPYQFFTDPQDRIHVYFQNQGGLGTVAGLASFYYCGISGITVIKNYAADSDLTRNILSHEIGHNLHCEHTTGFIMNPSVNFSSAWAPESIASINNTVNTLSCIAGCNTLPCEDKKVSGITFTADTASDQVTLSWIAEPGMAYLVKLLNISDPANWPDYTTLSYPTNSITYPISQIYCSDRYRFIIIPQCGGIDGQAENILFNVSQGVTNPTLTNWTGFTDYFSGPIYPYQTLCSGNRYSCGLTAIDAGTAPVYQWRVNGISVGNNSNTLMIDTLQDNDVLSCELTSNADCVASSTAFFSTSVHVVDPIPLHIVMENTSASTVCIGEAITVTQSIDLNAAYEQIPHGSMDLVTYLNGNVIDNFVVDAGFALNNESRTFTFTPTESGILESRIDLGTGQNGETIGCYLNQSAYSLPIDVVVMQEPCNLGIPDLEVPGLAYYPNPVREILNLDAKEPITAITVYTVLGQVISAEIVNSGKTTLDFSTVAKGTYFLKIAANQKISNIKIIKE